jgi:DeoR/GlpR family transcriptional regulator of sugar metabolism
VETVTDEDILDLLTHLPGPVITTTDVAETFDMTTEGARRKLNDLCDEGVLDRRKSGQTRVYWRIDPEQPD